jgi:hypothetical protein
MKSIFNIYFGRLAEQLLPFSMRSMSILTLMRSAFASWEHGLRERFERACNDDMFDLQHNGQVCYLRAALNAKFGDNDNRFDIVDIYGDAEWIYIGSDSDLAHRAYIIDERSDHDCFFIPDEMFLDIKNTFVVCVPENRFNERDLPVIKRFVNKYRLITRVPLYKPQNN